MQISLFARITISAAADGVGARRSATKSQIVKSVSWPTRRSSESSTPQRRARRLLVERPQILERSSAAADQHDVVQLPAREMADGDGDLARGGRALHADRIDLQCSPSKRRPRTLRMSRIAAPVGLVTMAMRCGSIGIGFLRAGRTALRRRAASSVARMPVAARRGRPARRRRR